MKGERIIDFAILFRVHVLSTPILHRFPRWIYGRALRPRTKSPIDCRIGECRLLYVLIVLPLTLAAGFPASVWACNRRHGRRAKPLNPSRCCVLGIPNAAQVAPESATNARRIAAHDALGLALVRTLPASFAVRVRSGSYSVGPGSVQRHATPTRALHCLRRKGCDDPASRLGRE